uniref:Uncharacterized protein n=1 Tax=Oryza brachyantha TaxID=4533 RepID=J3LGK9_ORYBR
MSQYSSREDQSSILRPIPKYAYMGLPCWPTAQKRSRTASIGAARLTLKYGCLVRPRSVKVEALRELHLALRMVGMGLEHPNILSSILEIEDEK